MTRLDRPYALFSREEMTRRHERARTLMAEQDFDALLISGDENFQYFTGANASLAQHTSLTRPSLCIFPREGRPIVISQGGFSLTLGSYIEEVRAYDGIVEFPVEAAVSALRDAAPKLDRVGVELGQEQRMGLPVADYLALVDRMREVAFMDAAQLIIHLRMVKSDEELCYMRRAADITGRARQRLFDEVRPGMTERDVSRRMSQLMLEEGADASAFVILQLDKPGAGCPYHYERPIEHGEVLAIDAGAYVGMYTIDYARMATFGPATDTQKRTHAAVMEVTGKMTDALGPGLRCSELFRLGKEAILATGLDADSPARIGRGRMGHGQGLLITEPPSVCAEDHTMLEPGVVISTEPGVRIGNVQFVWEDVHVITDNGSEQITLESPVLRELEP